MTPTCLLRETMFCEAVEAVRYHVLGDRFAALHHVRKALGIASRLKDRGARQVLMTYQNQMRRNPK